MGAYYYHETSLQNQEIQDSIKEIYFPLVNHKAWEGKLLCHFLRHSFTLRSLCRGYQLTGSCPRVQGENSFSWSLLGKAWIPPTRQLKQGCSCKSISWKPELKSTLEHPPWRVTGEDPWKPSKSLLFVLVLLVLEKIYKQKIPSPKPEASFLNIIQTFDHANHYIL